MVIVNLKSGKAVDKIASFNSRYHNYESNQYVFIGQIKTIVKWIIV